MVAVPSTWKTAARLHFSMGKNYSACKVAHVYISHPSHIYRIPAGISNTCMLGILHIARPRYPVPHMFRQPSNKSGPA